MIVNVKDEPFKLHALGGDSETSGGYILHNTVVKSGSSLQVSTSSVSRNFIIENNLFIANPTDGYSVRWDQPRFDPSNALDYNGYYPDGKFELGYSNVGNDKTYNSFAALLAAGFAEQHGLLVGVSNFASGLATPSDYAPLLAPADVELAASALGIDKAIALANINDDYQGAGPHLGAIELGCVKPWFGPRPVGQDESTMKLGCGGTTPAGDGGPEPSDGSAGHPDGAAGSPDGAAGSPDGGAGHADGAAGHLDGATGFLDGSAGHSDSGAVTKPAAGSADDSSGCGCRSAPGPLSPAGMVAAALALLALIQRRVSTGRFERRSTWRRPSSPTA